MGLTAWIIDFVITYGIKLLVITLVYGAVKTALMFLITANKEINNKYRRWIKKKMR